jgi:hypothetical protein
VDGNVDLLHSLSRRLEWLMPEKIPSRLRLSRAYISAHL